MEGVERDGMHADSSLMSTAVLPWVMPVQPAVVPEIHFPLSESHTEKIIASGSGVSVGIVLTEPALFLQGYHQHDSITPKQAILRGYIHLKLTKRVKIQIISICFRGQAQTNWPEGIPPKNNHFHDKKDVFTHNIVYFRHDDTTLMMNDYGAHYYQHTKLASSVPEKDCAGGTTRGTFPHRDSKPMPNTVARKVADRLSIQTIRRHVRNFNKKGPFMGIQAQSHRNYRSFPMGNYLYSFEIPIDSSLPETIKTDCGFVRYDLEAVVECASTFHPKVLGSMEIPLIRTPAEASLEHIEPISISRNWKDQLYYELVIYGKSFSLGSHIPIEIKFTPSVEVECNRIKVYITENIQCWTTDKMVHRLRPAKKFLLLEESTDAAGPRMCPETSVQIKASGGTDLGYQATAASGDKIVSRSTTTLLGKLSGESSSFNLQELKFDVQLPSCHTAKSRDKRQLLHCDTTYENIQINHWIKIELYLSVVVDRDTGRRQRLKISIDSPLRMLSSKVTQANIYLPVYTREPTHPNPPTQELGRGCSGTHFASRKNLRYQGLRRWAASHSFRNISTGLTRRLHANLTLETNGKRVPSSSSPAFEDNLPPSPPITPPPYYTPVVCNRHREVGLGN